MTPLGPYRIINALMNLGHDHQPLTLVAARVIKTRQARITLVFMIIIQELLFVLLCVDPIVNCRAKVV
jgi:hypothetical protein